jgi:hypothetical protein
MARITLNPIIENASGRMGNLAFRRAQNGEMNLIKRADMSNVTWTDAQKEHRQNFKKAIAYAKAAMATPKVRAVYEKAGKKQNKRPFALAVSDYFKGKDLLS